MPRQEQAAATLPPRQTAAMAAGSPSSVKALMTQPPVASPVIVIGFLGGRVKKNDAIHREVQLAMRLRRNHPDGVYAQVFQNSHGDRAFEEIERLLDANHDGTMSPAEKQHAQIILYGHSWGASETVTMARQLQTAGIPVLLAILVDRVSKIGAGDPRIPANVAQAVNFYQLDGLLHGRDTIRAADPASTEILGNYRFDYRDNHVSCDQYPWYARLFMGPHIEIENDPRVWNQVESLIRAKLPPGKTTAAATLPRQSQ
jgi:pimeloyl-ACP methyl ester carboxylesterase